MATNIIVARDRDVHGCVFADLYGASGLGANDDGYWIYVGDLDGISVHFSGINGDTCKLFGSNTQDEPTDATDHITLATVSADAIQAVTVPVRWLKADFTKGSGTAVHAYMLGHIKR